MRPDRIETEEPVLVDVISCTDPSLNDVHMSGKILDISETGMKVTMATAVPEKTLLGFRLDTGTDVFRLEGEVRWITNNGEVMMGILLDKTCSDFTKWTELFEFEY